MKSIVQHSVTPASLSQSVAAVADKREQQNLTFYGIQYLRGVAALMVAYFHLAGQLPIYDAWFRDWFAGTLNFASGVDIFFVVSGFIMVITSARDTPWMFLEKRLIRIVPLYWIITLFVVAGYLAAPGMFRTTVVNMEYIAKSLLFIPYQNPGHDGDIVPLLVPGWSLNFEMAFYVVFAISLLLPLNRRVLLVGLLFSAMLALKSVFWQASTLTAFKFYLQPRIMEFWLGMAIGELVRLNFHKKFNIYVFAALVVISTISLLVPAAAYAAQVSILFSEVAVVVSAAVLVFAVVGLEAQGAIAKIRWLKGIGDASYSVYLSHIFTFGVVRAVWVKVRLDHGALADAMAFAAVSMLAVTIVGWLLFSCLEKPLLSGMRSIFVKR